MNPKTTSIDPDAPDWSKGNGLLPAIVQHADDGTVLMLGFMNRAALVHTRASGLVTFYSRSKQRLWTKGETSGHGLVLRGLHLDCDADAVLVLAAPRGPTCHTGTRTCFGDSAVPELAFLAHLDRLVAQRHDERPDGSYTSELFDAGLRRIAQKLGEEGVETALAAVTQGDEAVLDESADLIYHLLVLLRARGLGLDALVTRLHQRHP